MSSMIMNMAVPCNSVCSRRASKLPWKVSSATPRVPATRKTRAVNCIDETSTVRRSGNYNPTLWDFNYIQSLNSEYREERYSKKASELVLQVKKLLEEEKEGIRRLELINNLQKLGISYHFEDNIKQILDSVYHHQQHQQKDRDLYSTALEFRLLRQNGFSVSQEVFDGFKNERGEFMASLGEDTKGLLQLYEASFLLMEGEETLEEAGEFSTNILQKKVDDDDGDGDVAIMMMVRHALELPLHWRQQRINARWFIDAYASGPDMNPVLLELAKLDFNILQATHQEELKHVSRWWEQTGLAKKLPFARDRLVECYSWGVGEMCPPQYGYARTINTKVNVLITVMDDMFDVYGTPQELHAFNNILQRWDIEGVEQLPEYMQICFVALNNFVDEMAYDVLKEQGFFILPYLRKSWSDLFKSYIQEVEWYSAGYTPTLEEYITSSWLSVGGPIMLAHEFFAVTNPIEKEAAESLYKYHELVRCATMILRLANDLGTSKEEMERGDVPKSIECYMNDSGAGSEEAREYIKSVISETWKKMNKEMSADPPFSPDFVRGAADLGRTAQYMYQLGDGFGVQTSWIKHRISTLLFEPFSL